MPIVLAEPSEESLRIAAVQALVYRQYFALAQAAPLDPVSGLGGKLLFAGDLARNSDLLRAANIAGAASLAASSDPAAARAAMREGSIDFLVTSLEEALRILKNEVRKRQPVSVSVAVAPEEISRQMLERGVLPDLLGPDLNSDLAHTAQGFLDQGAIRIPEGPAAPYAFWSVHQDSAAWMPKLDACVRAFLAADQGRERWLRLAPRYLGRTALKLHGVQLAQKEEAGLRSELEAIATGPGDAVPGDIGSGNIGPGGGSKESPRIPRIGFGLL